MTIGREKSFLTRFWTLFREEDEQAKRLIRWSNSGSYFYILDTSRDREHLTRLAIERGILQRVGHGKRQAMRKTPKYDNISRQLRYYGWNRRQELDRGLQIAWSHPYLHRDSSITEVKRSKSNAPSKSMQHIKHKKHKKYQGGRSRAGEEGKEYYNRCGSMDQCTTISILPNHTNIEPIPVDSGTEQQTKTTSMIIYDACMVTFDKPLKLYDLENVEEEMARSRYDVDDAGCVEEDEAIAARGAWADTQTPSPTLAPQMDWKVFDLGIMEGRRK